MREVLLDIKDLTDSKEVYGERPNPFLTIFVYSVLALFVAALIYSMIGKIDVVATADGMVRPNEQVSNVSSIVGGKVTAVNYIDGQEVKAGDVLMSIDSTGTKASLDDLKDAQKKSEFDKDLNQKFVTSIQQNKNLFNSDPNGEEYSYYIQYENYAVSLKNTTVNSKYNEDKTNLQILALNKQMSQLDYAKAALALYKSSIEQGTNLLGDYPEYSHQYDLYKSTQDALESDYKSKKVSINSDTTSDSNALAISYYTAQISGYQTAISSVNDLKDYFDANDKGEFHQMYKEYVNQLGIYQAACDLASDNYSTATNGGSVGKYSSDLLTYYTTMLEGYSLFRSSVVAGKDVFSDSAPSVSYRYLYQKYVTDLAAYTDATSAASFKTTTLASIDNTILQTRSNIASQNISITASNANSSVSVAQDNINSAASTMNAYKATTLKTLNDTLAQLQNKLAEAQISSKALRPKTDLVAELDTNYAQSKSQKYLSAMTQIESDAKATDTQITSNQSELETYKRMEQMYQSEKDSKGQYSDVSFAQLQQLAKCLNNVDTLESNLSDLNAKIKQAELQVDSSNITAQQDGIVNNIVDIGVGDVLSAGTAIATVIPHDESEYKVQLYVANKDIAGIEVGDTVRYNISAMPSNQYGAVEGKVLSVSQDTKVQNNQQSGYYLVEASIANGTLTDKDGNQAKISVGMTLEGKVVTQRKRILSYLLEKIK